jgi:hypothetical protein
MRHLSGGVCFSLVQSRLKSIEKAPGRHLGVCASVSSPTSVFWNLSDLFSVYDRQQNALGHWDSIFGAKAVRSLS